MADVGVRELKAQLSQQLKRVQRGAEASVVATSLLAYPEACAAFGRRRREKSVSPAALKAPGSDVIVPSCGLARLGSSSSETGGVQIGLGPSARLARDAIGQPARPGDVVEDAAVGATRRWRLIAIEL